MINTLKRTDPRFTLPVSRSVVSGWKDYDEEVLKTKLALPDQVAYLQNRLKMVVFDPLDSVFLRSAPNHAAVNGPNMSFFFIGSTVICCCIEALGGFVLHSAKDNGKRFKAFIENYMSPWSVTSARGVSVSDWLWKNLRNGLAHSLIILDGGLDDLGADRFRHKGGKQLEVHAEILYSDLKDGVKKYFKEITSNPSATLATNFEKHFKSVFQTF